MGVVRLFTPFVTANGDPPAGGRVWTELLIGGVSVLSIAGYIVFFPLKHSQYLIPIALFVCYYAADALSVVFDWFEKRGGTIAAMILLVGMCAILVHVAAQVNEPKLVYTNELQRAQTASLQKLIAPKTEVFDLEGRIFWAKNPYYICCVPMGEFMNDLTLKIPAVRDTLEKKKVAYVFQGDSGRMERLPSEDVLYIQMHYEPVEGWGEALWRRK